MSFTHLSVCIYIYLSPYTPNHYYTQHTKYTQHISCSFLSAISYSINRYPHRPCPCPKPVLSVLGIVHPARTQREAALGLGQGG